MNKSNPEISVIIPAFNAEKNIKNTLESLLNQTFENFEVILVNDGSSDNTESVVKEFMAIDNRIKYIYQTNSGVAIARNTGIDNSSGNYISFLDSDDYYDKFYLEKMYKKIKEENGNICYCGYNLTNGSTRKNKTKFNSDNLLLDFILGKIKVHISCVLINREFLLNQNIRFPKGVQWGEDFEFLCLLFKTGYKICYIKEYLSYYRIDHNENQLSKFSLDKIDLDFESIQRLINNERINCDKRIVDALLKYRLKALIVYRLWQATEKELDVEDILKYYKKYENVINEKYNKNGLRSIKLNLYTLRLKRYINNVTKEI